MRRKDGREQEGKETKRTVHRKNVYTHLENIKCNMLQENIFRQAVKDKLTVASMMNSWA